MKRLRLRKDGLYGEAKSSTGFDVPIDVKDIQAVWWSWFGPSLVIRARGEKHGVSVYATDFVDIVEFIERHSGFRITGTCITKFFTLLWNPLAFFRPVSYTHLTLPTN